MESEEEIKTFYGRCRCCLEYGYMKSMWKQHMWDDEPEIYGEMLMETFNIAWDSDSSDEHICEACIKRLRDAYHFKKDVLCAEHMMQENFDEDGIEVVTLKDALFTEEDDDVSSVKMEQELKMEQEVKMEQEDDLESVDDKAEFGEIEFLEEDAELVEQSVNTLEKETDSDEAPKRKWPQKKKRPERSSYRNYTQTDLKKCLEAVQTQGLSQSEAARMYNIPTKTVNVKMLSLQKKQESPMTEEKLERRERIQKTFKFVEEIQNILEMTNSMPFKVKSTKLYCAYCFLSGPFYEDPDELRIHTLTTHVKDRNPGIEAMLRPFWLNEVLRIDIMNLSCTVCESRIAGWNEMFQHLFDEHKMEFDQAYTRLIPYKLSTDLHCALCNERHSNFHYLDSHMNAHYNNHVCPDCGDTFVSANRIKKHMIIHSTGSFPCEQCNKVFSLKKYKDKHTAMIHEKLKTYKCFYCTERFVSEYGKHMHTKECHREKIKFINCEICGKMFDWRPYYLSHLKKTHRKVQKYQCSFCMKWFARKHDYKLHVERHTGDGKYVCEVCTKKFVTRQELRSHQRVHNKGVKTVNLDKGVKTKILEISKEVN